MSSPVAWLSRALGPTTRDAFIDGLTNTAGDARFRLLVLEASATAGRGPLAKDAYATATRLRGEFSGLKADCKLVARS